MIGILGEFRIKVMLGRCVLVERKMREWLKKILEKQNMYLLSSSVVVYDCGMLVDKNRERLFLNVYDRRVIQTQ